MNPLIQAILFDLGDTLMYSLAPWPPVFDRAGRELANALCASHVSVDCDTFHIDFRQRLDEYYAERERNLFETSTSVVLRKLLAEAITVFRKKSCVRLSIDSTPLRNRIGH
jgi:hypothetical protein